MKDADKRGPRVGRTSFLSRCCPDPRRLRRIPPVKEVRSEDTSLEQRLAKLRSPKVKDESVVSEEIKDVEVKGPVLVAKNGEGTVAEEVI